MEWPFLFTLHSYEHVPALNQFQIKQKTDWLLLQNTRSGVLHLHPHCVFNPIQSRGSSSRPNRLMIPQPTHTSRLRPTDPVPANTPLGEIKMPDPIIVPTMRQIPDNSPTLFFRLTWPRFLSFRASFPSGLLLREPLRWLSFPFARLPFMSSKFWWGGILSVDGTFLYASEFFVIFLLV